MALGYSENFITSKHSQLLGWFNKNFIKPGILNKKLGQIYIRAYDNRKKSDYTLTETPDVETLQNDIANAEMFVKSIKEVLRFARNDS